MYNKAILMGRICHDLELKTTSNGVSVLSFRLAVERSFSGKGEERKTDFFDIVAWRHNAEFICRYFSKGRMILIDGELQTRQYTDKNNQARNVTEIVVSSATFTGEAKNTANSPPAAPVIQQPAVTQSVGGEFADAGTGGEEYLF